VKYLAIAEWCPEDADRVFERAQVSFSEREQGTDKYPKFVFPSHVMIGMNKTFQVYEGTLEQLSNVENHWVGLVNWKFIPIIETSKHMELYEKRAK
jgi:hypothetical protein